MYRMQTSCNYTMQSGSTLLVFYLLIVLVIHVSALLSSLNIVKPKRFHTPGLQVEKPSPRGAPRMVALVLSLLSAPHYCSSDKTTVFGRKTYIVTCPRRYWRFCYCIIDSTVASPLISHYSSYWLSMMVTSFLLQSRISCGLIGTAKPLFCLFCLSSAAFHMPTHKLPILLIQPGFCEEVYSSLQSMSVLYRGLLLLPNSLFFNRPPLLLPVKSAHLIMWKH